MPWGNIPPWRCHFSQSIFWLVQHLAPIAARQVGHSHCFSQQRHQSLDRYRQEERCEVHKESSTARPEPLGCSERAPMLIQSLRASRFRFRRISGVPPRCGRKSRSADRAYASYFPLPDVTSGKSFVQVWVLSVDGPVVKSSFDFTVKGKGSEKWWRSSAPSSTGCNLRPTCS